MKTTILLMCWAGLIWQLIEGLNRVFNGQWIGLLDLVTVPPMALAVLTMSMLVWPTLADRTRHLNHRLNAFASRNPR